MNHHRLPIAALAALCWLGACTTSNPKPALQQPPKVSQDPAPKTSCEGVAQALAKDAKEDQEDRAGGWQNIDWEQVGKRDAARRSRVAQWHKDGCIQGVDALFEAALIMQHGNAAEDFMLGYTLLTEAEQLKGETIALRALAADRWLMNKGYKQWFLSQALRPDMESCWCMAPFEEDKFTDEERAARGGKTLADATAWLKELNSQLPQCAQAPLVCSKEAASAPADVFPELQNAK